MSIYDQDFNYIFQELLPPDKRLPVFSAYGAAMVKPLQWLHDLTFIDYADGTAGNEYSSVTAYVKGNRVHYNQKVYEAKQSTTGNAPTTGDSSDLYWSLVLNDFRGARERVTYNGQKLTLEWILNKWFGTNFLQPDSSHPANHSDFYIVTEVTDDNSFLLAFDSSSGPSYMGLIDGDYMGLTYSASVNDFTVYYPIGKIPTTSDLKYIQMVALVNRYKLYGTNPRYISY